MSLDKRVILANLVLFVMATSLSFFIVKNFIYDAFVYLSTLWFIFLLFITWRTKANLRLWAFYSAVAILAFGLTEAYWLGWFFPKNRARLTGSVTESGYYQPNRVLGYGPGRSVAANARKEYNGETLYHVKYTIGPAGLRECKYTTADSVPAALFFGGSFTFGEGVDDRETLPCRFEEKSKGRLQSFNFGFHGYGPHQMLATLEHKLESEIIGSREAKYLIYQALPSHVKRCSGRSSWDFAGPRYVLHGQSGIHRAGEFNTSFKRKVLQLVSRSQVFRRLLSYLQKGESGDVDLFIEIVKRSRKIFTERYGGQFYVILWQLDNNPLYEEILSKLRMNGVNVIEASHIIPDFEANLAKYVIRVPIDYHPNAVAYNLIADYLLQFLKSIS